MKYIRTTGNITLTTDTIEDAIKFTDEIRTLAHKSGMKLSKEMEDFIVDVEIDYIIHTRPDECQDAIVEVITMDTNE